MRGTPGAYIARLLFAIVWTGLGDASLLMFCPGLPSVPTQWHRGCSSVSNAPSARGVITMVKRRGEGDGDGIKTKRLGSRIVRVSIDEMFPGMELEGIIRSIKPYGAFVDVGSTTDGLLHISNLLPMHREHYGNELIVTASEGEKVLVEVMGVDTEKGRFSLREVALPERKPTVPSETAKGGAPSSRGKSAMSVKEVEDMYGGIVTGDEQDPQEAARAKQKDEKKVLEKWGKRMEGKGLFRNFKEGVVRSVTEYGVFVDIGGPVDGLCHVSEIEGKSSIDRYGTVLLKAGDKVMARLLQVDAEGGKVSLSMRKWEPSQEEADREALEIVATLKVKEDSERSPQNSAFAAAWRKAIEKS